MIMKPLSSYIIIFVIVPLSLAALLVSGCKNKVNEPPADDPIKPGRRDYTWTVDTLSHPGSMQTLMEGIWASSPHDVYVVGFNDRGGIGAMYHYDGLSWSSVKLLTVEGGLIQHGFSLHAIYGFSPSNIYAVGSHGYEIPPFSNQIVDSSLIIHFNGSEWTEVSLPKFPGWFYCVGGDPSTGDVWAMGNATNAVFHKPPNGQWLQDSLPIATATTDYQTTSVSVVSGSEIYASGSTPYIDGSATYYIFHHTGSTWNIMDSVSLTWTHNVSLWGYSLVWRTPWNALYTAGGDIFIYRGLKWEREYSSSKYLTRMFGTNSKNIFAVGSTGAVVHYDGSNWYSFTKFPPTNLAFTDEFVCDGWTDGNEIFLIVQSQGLNTLMLHGKLAENTLIPRQ
jgi:hypothetical protein